MQCTITAMRLYLKAQNTIDTYKCFLQTSSKDTAPNGGVMNTLDITLKPMVIKLNSPIKIFLFNKYLTFVIKLKKVIKIDPDVRNTTFDIFKIKKLKPEK